MIKFNSKDIIPMMNGVQLSRVMYNGKQVWPEPMNVVEVQLSDTVAGDVCAYDGSNKRFFRFVDSGATDNIKNYTPIGVVVVPASHNVYGDGSCGVMSLKLMNCSTPSTGGTSKQYMYWGVYGTDISALPNLNQVPIVGSGSNVGNAGSTVTGEEYHAYLPSDKFSAVQCPHDTDAYYYGSSNSYDQAPSPYLTDGSRNPAYYQTSSPSSSNNALADFDGIGNTEKIIIQRGTKDYNSWTPGRTTESDYPAASCCDMFHTEGTSQGDWYLPACGELGYIMPTFNKINQAIANIRQAYGSSVGVELLTNNYYWSSTEYSRNYTRRVDTYNSSIWYSNKNYANYVLAWLKVSPLDMSGTSPESASNGVYVYANNGKLYTPEEWDTANNDLAVGVAVVTDNCRFVIDKTERNNGIAWSNELYVTDVSGILSTTDPTTARTDYAGENNTALIRAAASGENSSNNAAHWCYAQTIKVNGATKHGYLAAVGEWQAAYDNKSAVDSALSKIGGAAMLTGYHWSSTEYISAVAWRLDWNGGNLSSYGKGGTGGYAVPMYPLD